MQRQQRKAIDTRHILKAQRVDARRGPSLPVWKAAFVSSAPGLIFKFRHSGHKWHYLRCVVGLSGKE